MSQPRPPIALRPTQRRRFEAVLTSLDDALVKIEQLVGAPQTLERRLTHVVADVPSTLLEQAQPLLKSLRTRINEGVERMDLHPTVLRTSQHVRAVLSLQVIQFEDSRTKAMLGYGALPPESGLEVERYVQAMIDDLAELRHLLLPPRTRHDGDRGTSA